MLTASRKPRTISQPRLTLQAPQPLENGDRLGAAEFLRRYDAMPELKKAELINGVVHMASPVRAKHHGTPDSLIQGWLVYYSAHTPGTRVAANSTVRFDADNVPQPDSLLMIEGGNAKVGKDGYIHGAPEIVVEIAASSASIDLHDKLDAYRRAGVLEYVVWRTADQACDWFVLEDDRYIQVQPDRHGIIRSRVFPGLSLDVNALLDEDAKGLLARLAKTMKKPEHRAFVSRLKKR